MYSGTFLRPQLVDRVMSEVAKVIEDGFKETEIGLIPADWEIVRLVTKWIFRIKKWRSMLCNQMIFLYAKGVSVGQVAVGHARVARRRNRGGQSVAGRPP